MKKIIKIAASAVTVACLSVSLSGGAIAASKVDSFKVGVVDYMTVFQMVPQGKEKLTELLCNFWQKLMDLNILMK